MELGWASKDETLYRDAIESLMKQIDKPSSRIATTLANHVLHLLALNCESTPSLFNTLLFYLERDHEIARKNIVFVIGEVVEKEASTNHTLHFTKVVKKNIKSISHGCGEKNSKVRAHFHEWIIRWINYKIVPKQFLSDLQSKEQKWMFSKPAPNFSVSQEQSPGTFDMVMAGIIGNGLDPSYNNLISTSKCIQIGDEEKFQSFCTKIVYNGIEDGIKDGWMYIDRDGHHKVRIIE